MEEHVELRLLLERLQKALDVPNPGDIGPTLEKLRSRLESHRLKEDGILLPAVRRFGCVSARALRSIEQEHEGEESGLERALALYRKGDSAGLVHACRTLISFYRNHFDKEERTVFPPAERELPDEIKWELMVEMEAEELPQAL